MHGQADHFAPQLVAILSESPGGAGFEPGERLFVVARDPRLLRVVPVLQPFMGSTP